MALKLDSKWLPDKRISLLVLVLTSHIHHLRPGHRADTRGRCLKTQNVLFTSWILQLRLRRSLLVNEDVVLLVVRRPQSFTGDRLVRVFVIPKHNNNTCFTNLFIFIS